MAHEEVRVIELPRDAMRRLGDVGPCTKECEAAFEKPDLFILKWVETKYGRCPKCWDKMKNEKKKKFLREFGEVAQTPRALQFKCPSFCKAVVVHDDDTKFYSPW